MKGTWFRFAAQADPKVADVYIDDFIGDWVDQMINEWLDVQSPITAKAFVNELAALPDEVAAIVVHINSPGGDVFAATQIANALREQAVSKGRTVDTLVEGLAASAASIIAMAGGRVRMADNALLMIHNPWTVGVGDAAEMRKAADVLDQVRDAIVATYQWHSPLEAKEIVKLMDAETWMSADEAIEHGFATEKVAGLKAAASIDPRHAPRLKVPERFAAQVAAFLKPEEPAPPPVEPPTPPTPPANASAEEIVGLCEAAGLDVAFAARLIKVGATLADAQQLVSAEKERRAAENSRQDSIRALCSKFKVDGLAPELIAGGMPFDQAKAVVQHVKAMVDKVEIDGNLNPDAGLGRKPVIDVAAIYRERNKLPH